MTDDYIFELLEKLGFSKFQADTGVIVLTTLLMVVGAVIAARLGSRVARRSVESMVARSALPGVPARSKGRAMALGGVAASAVRMTVWFVAVLLILGQLGVNLGPLLAGASIVGVAVGFGAQTLVRDFLSGFFVLAEDQFGVGDEITIAGETGTVEVVSLRVTRIRSSDGTVWFVPNGEMRKVGNAARDWSRATVDIVVPPGADLTAVTAALTEEAAALGQDPAWSSKVLEEPQVLGVESLGPDGNTVRVVAKTSPHEQGGVARELRARIGVRLRREGVLPVVEPTAAPSAAGGGGDEAPHDAEG